MIGAVMTKRAVAQSYDAISRQDLDALQGMFHEDAVLEFPGDTVMSGRFEGWEAIRGWFDRWFKMSPETRFTPRHVLVENIFALGASNVVHVEWDLDEVTRQGDHNHLTGVTTFGIDGGKGRQVVIYIYDPSVLASMWPPKRAAAEETEDKEQGTARA